MPWRAVPKPTVTTNSTTASSTAPAAPSHRHGSPPARSTSPPCSERAAHSHAKYSAVGNSSGRTTVATTRSMAPSLCQHLGEVHQNPGGGAPDVAPLVRQHEKAAEAAGGFTLDTLMVAPVKDVGER